MLRNLWQLLTRTPPTSSARARRQKSRPRLGLELLEQRTAPAILTVNSILDTANTSDAYLSLREAIAIVNSPTLPSGLSTQITGQISGTLHAGGSDTIVFDPTQVTAPIILGRYATGAEPAQQHGGGDHRRRHGGRHCGRQ